MLATAVDSPPRLVFVKLCHNKDKRSCTFPFPSLHFFLDEVVFPITHSSLAIHPGGLFPVCVDRLNLYDSLLHYLLLSLAPSKSSAAT